MRTILALLAAPAYAACDAAALADDAAACVEGCGLDAAAADAACDALKCGAYCTNSIGGSDCIAEQKDACEASAKLIDCDVNCDNAAAAGVAALVALMLK